jgi:UPF0755 protein
MTGNRTGYWAVFGVLFLLTLFMLAVLGYGAFATSLDAGEGLVVEVRPGETLSHLSQRLAAEGRLRNPRLLRVLALLRGDPGRIKVGDYAFQGAVSPSRLLDTLTSGGGELSALTIPEGYSLQDIAAKVEAEGLGKAAELLRLAHDPAFIAGLDLPFPPRLPTLEGFLFPETYFIHRSAGEAALLTAMARQFKKRAAKLIMDSAPAARLTPYEVLILASIIEKETGVAEERPLVAAVFHNRLKVHMRLASDPTVIYGLAEFDGNLTRKHLLTPTPYNTYLKSGLPPTPIASPGLASLKAALAPASVGYLFFVSKGDGTHRFSLDYAAHEQAVYRYQKRPHQRPPH